MSRCALHTKSFLNIIVVGIFEFHLNLVFIPIIMHIFLFNLYFWPSILVSLYTFRNKIVNERSHTRSTMYGHSTSCIKYCGRFGRWAVDVIAPKSAKVNVASVYFIDKSWREGTSEIHSRKHTWCNTPFDSWITQQFWTNSSSNRTFYTVCCMLQGKNFSFE